jgi:hypothetical protein
VVVEAVAVEGVDMEAEADMEAILVMWQPPLLKTLGSSPPWVASEISLAFVITLIFPVWNSL